LKDLGYDFLTSALFRGQQDKARFLIRQKEGKQDAQPRPENLKMETDPPSLQLRRDKKAETSRARTLVESDPAAGYIVNLLSTTDLPDQQSLKAHGLAWRLFSASEVLLGAVIVIGHNVFHIVPK
jgi:hypothetical protein